MRVLKIFLLILVFATAVYAQEQAKTEDLGLGAFANEHGAILLAVDASLVDFNIDAPYSMFIVYMASKNQNQEITVYRDGVVMIYNGHEYHMPPLKELRDKYSGALHDLDFYRHLGKEGLISSWVRFYNFPQRDNFFPPLGMRAPLAVDQASLYSFHGFRTPCYFKNPGFKKGDKLTIRVVDKKNPQLMGECEVVLQ
jgi:hypothetical protein